MSLVSYPPKNYDEYSYIDYFIWGIIPVRIVVRKRVDGWCAYALLKYMPIEYAELYGTPTPFEAVRDFGDKLPEEFAREIFPEMIGSYAH